MLSFLLVIAIIFLVSLIAFQIYKHFHPEEDVYSDEAIKAAKLLEYPANLTYDEIMEYKINRRVAILGVNSFKELYEQYPDYLRLVEKRHLANIGLINFTEDADVKKVSSVSEQDDEKLMELPLEERMEALGVDDYTEMCRDYPEYVTNEEFEALLRQGAIHSVDDVIYFKGRYYENEFSEEWEEHEYEWDKDHRKF